MNEDQDLINEQRILKKIIKNLNSENNCCLM
jgi:hypothetical protein